MANDNLPNRLDRLKGPRPNLPEQLSANRELPEGGEPEPVGPSQGSEEWRQLYETIRDATIRLRS